MKKGLYKFKLDYGRMGDLYGVFIEEQELVNCLIENELEVYFGEVLGKHSEVYEILKESDFTLVSEDPTTIKLVEDLGLETGYNPFDYGVNNTLKFEDILTSGEYNVREVCLKLIEFQTYGQ